MSRNLNYGKVAGFLVSIASIQFVLLMVVSEALYAGYSVSSNYISDLGVGATAPIFNSSVFLLGVMTVAAVYFIHCLFNSKIFSICLLLTGVGAMGVGLFPEDFGILHTIASLITFLFGALSTIASYRFLKAPLSYLAIILGLLSFFALVLFGLDIYLDLGRGGMERMIAYPILLWAIGFGGHLVGLSEKG